MLEKELITVEEFAELIHLTPETIRRKARRYYSKKRGHPRPYLDNFPEPLRVGKRLLFRRKGVFDWLKSLEKKR